MLTGKTAKYICLITGFLLICLAIYAMSRNWGGKHYSAKVLSVVESYKTEEFVKSGYEGGGELKNVYHTILDVQYINDDKQNSETQITITRYDEKSLPEEGESLEIQLLGDGTVSEYQPVRFSMSVTILVVLGIIMVAIGIFGKIRT